MIRHRRGFTVIELMSAVAVMLVLLAIAQPSFESMRQRAAIRSAGERALGFWNQARLESAKRNQLVKIGVVNNGSGMCLGAATTTDRADDEACDCFEANSADADYCDVARFPSDQGEWKLVTLAGTPSLGSDLDGLAIIEPKRTNLTDSSAAGAISFSGPPGRWSYKLNLNVDRFGRAMLCESTAAVDHLSDYGTRKCAD